MTAPISWPKSLPKPTIASYGYSPDDAVLATDLEFGPRRTRQRFTATPTSYTVRWLMTTNQLAVFEYFHKNVISQGAAYFSVELKQGAGFLPVDARFIGPFNVTGIKPELYEVTASLQVRDRPLITAEQYFILNLDSPEEFLFYESVFDELVTTDLPETLG